MKLSNKNTVFFVCSRIVKADKKLVSVARARVGVGFSGCLGLEYDVIGEQVGMRFQTGGKCGQGWNQVICV